MTPLRRRAALVWTLGFLAGAALPLTAAPDDPASWLGHTPVRAYEDRGAPVEVYTLPVGPDSQAIHYYQDHTYLFWASNRVWQVRLDRLWTGSLGGVTMGMPREEVETLLGPPLAKSDVWSAWDLPYQAFPRRLRLVFVDGLLADAYLYRSDL